MNAAAHAPVLLNEMLAALAPADGGVYVDGTFGAGGYSRAILEAAPCRVIAIDRDPNVARFAGELAQRFAGRFLFIAGNFADMVSLLAAHGVACVHGIVLDLGVSSMQIDAAARGFSFRGDGPLDMRMSGEGLSAADIVNGWEESAIADVLYHYGEERASRRIARAIAQARAAAPIVTTAQLAGIIRSVVRPSGRIDPATRSFQALRIAVNDELGAVERALAAAPQLLTPGGRLVVVTFHSLEDRIVKRFCQAACGEKESVSRHAPAVVSASAHAPLFAWERRAAIVATEAEVARNPRARSAKLRAVRRTDAPFQGREARA